MIDEAKKQLVLDYQEVFGTDAGQRVLNDLAVHLNFNSSFAVAVQSGLPMHVGSELGKREGFLYIKDKIEADPNIELQEVAETEEMA